MGSRWEMEDFWLYVGALGFDPGAGNASSGLGGVAFDASYTQFLAIAHFIFTKLDQNLAEESLKNCGYSLFFAVPQFWKNYCRRLKDMADEDEGCVLQIPASVFSFPLGPKLIHMFYQLARRVVIKELKNDSVGTDVPFAVELSPEYMYMADVRHRVAYNKLLAVFQREDFVLQEYEEKAQILIKERKRIESEYAVLKMQFCKTEQHDQNKTDRTEKIKKVRSMWTLVIEMLASLKKEKEEVDSVLDVLEDCAGQCVLDGANVFSVPRLLCDRVKSDGCQHCTGNIYEAENLNFLTVIKLLNEAQRALRDEHCQCDLSQLLQFTENSIMLCNELLQNLEANRVKTEQQDLLSTRGSISRKQEDWKVMWENFLGQCPFNLILDQSPVLGLLRALPPCSDVAEEEDENIDFSPHLFSVSDVCDSVAERRSEKGDGALGTTIDESAAPATCRPGISSVPLELSEASENRDLLIGKNLHTETLKGKEEPVPPEILKDERDESAISETWQNADDHVIQRESPVKKEDPLKKFTEELAEEVAKAVVSESPQSGEEKGMTMEDLISLLAQNPFLTRKEIPRTPENLFNEIRSSWRKATETEGSSDVELAETEVMIEVPVDARLTMQKATDSRFVCSVPASPVPDFDPPLSESKSPLSSMECRPYKQVSGDHVESPVSETSGMQESGERTEAQELKCTVLNKSSVEDPKEHTSQYIKRSMNTEDTGSEHNSRTNVLLSDHCQSSSVRVMHTKPFLVSMSCESAHMGILEETLPELYSAGLNLSASSQSDFGITDSTYITGGSENHGNAGTPKLDLQSVSSIYEVLEETPSGSEEKLHQTHNGGETVILATENRYESCGSPKHFCLDEEFTKTPSPESLNEKKNSLSSLLVSCQHLEEMASMVHKIPSDVVRRWKDVCDSVAERRSEKGDGALGTTIDESAAPATCRPGISSVPLELSEASENRDLLIGKNLHTETLKGKEEPVPPEILKDERDESAISETWQNADDHVIQRESPVKKEDPLKKFTEELAEEVAKAVVSESPQSGEEKGMTMEDLISLLAQNPFLTRKEIPRTPENLFNEIRSSWRKATETEGSSDVELAETEVMIEVPVDARLTMQKATDSRFVCSVPASPVPDFDPPLSESKSPLSSMECRPYKQVSGDHVESPVSETSGMQESGERTEAQELKCTVLNKSSVEDPKEHTSQYIKRSMNTEDTGSEHNSRTNVLLSDHCQSSSVRVMHTKPFLVSMSCESAHMGILEETLPELYSAGLNLSASSQSDFGITDSTYITGGSENHGNAGTPKLDLQSVSSIYEVLEETPSGSEEKLHQTHNGGETVILATENRYESCGSPKHFCLDEEFTKTPSPESLNEKKNSLSSLLVSCQHLEEMASMVHKIPSDVVRRWKDVCDSVAERRSEKGDGALGTTIDESAAPATCRPGISSVPLELSEASENRDLLIGKNLHTETLKGKEEPVPPEILKDERDESAISETWQNADDHVIQRESPVKKEDPLKKFTEELAEEVAKAVVSESPQSGEEKGMTMEDLISLLAQNPFLTRKEIPRTPENLFNEIRSSWRKATETEGSSDVELAETEVMIEVPVDARLTMQKATDSRFVCSVPASPVPDFDPPLSESKSPLSSMECRPYKQVSGDHVESPVSETSGMQESGERTEAQELKCTVLNKSSVEDPKEHTSQYIKRSMNTEDTGSEHNSRTNVLLSDHCQSSSVRVMHTKPFLVSMSCESAHMGILEETLPELYSAGLNLSASSQSDFGITDSTYITGGSENHGNAGTPKLDLQSVSSIYEVLEETPSGSEEKLHQTHNGGETVILATENRYESCGSPKHFCLDEEFTKTPSPESLNEKKNSLSSLLVSCQHLEEMASMVHKIPSDVVRRWKDVCDSVAERRSEKGDGALGTTIDESAAPATCRPGISSVPLELSEASENRDLLIGKNLHTETLKGKEEPVPPEILKDERDESAISETWQNADDHVIQRESPVKKEDPLKKFTEELAEEIKSS